jgi:hypothetical protein
VGFTEKGEKMSKVNYLEKKIVESKQTRTPNYGMTVDGYTVNSGAPTSWMIKLENEKIWRRLMCWQFSNAGTLFVRIKGTEYVVDEYQIPR